MLMSSGAGRQLDKRRQLSASTSLETTDDGVEDAKVQAQLRRQRIPSSRKPSMEVASRRVADLVADVDERIARSACGNLDRQPEVHHGVEDDVIGGETTQRKCVSVGPRTAVKVVCISI